MTARDPVSQTTDQRIARRIRECCTIMSYGCSIAGPNVRHLTSLSDPLECEDCASQFVEAIRKALQDDGSDQ